MHARTKTETKWVAVHKGRYLIIDEYEVDMSNYGGSTTDCYSFGHTGDIFKATHMSKQSDFPKLHWDDKKGKYELKRITVTTTVDIE